LAGRLWQLVPRALHRGRCAGPRPWVAQGRRDHHRREWRYRVHAHVHLWLEEPETGGALYKKARRKKLAHAGMRYLDLGDLDGIEDLDIKEIEGAEEDEA
jgi:hypothetical protein